MQAHSFVLLIALLVSVESHLTAAISLAAPPELKHPIGYLEYMETGKYPSEIWLIDGSGRVMLPNPDDRIPSYQVIDTKDPDKRPPGLILAAGAYLLDNSLHPGSYRFRLDKSQRKIIPFMGQLYHVWYPGKDRVLLNRVTVDVPEKLQPAKKSRTIATTEVLPKLFWEQGPRRAGQKFFDFVTEFKIEDGRASFRLVPGATIGKPAESKRKPLEISVKKGDLLTARGRSYRVLNVVEPQRTPAGDLVGWLEISAEPVGEDKDEPPAEDKR